jgi:hypothetical protein
MVEYISQAMKQTSHSHEVIVLLYSPRLNPLQKDRDQKFLLDSDM